MAHPFVCNDLVYPLHISTTTVHMMLEASDQPVGFVSVIAPIPSALIYTFGSLIHGIRSYNRSNQASHSVAGDEPETSKKYSWRFWLRLFSLSVVSPLQAKVYYISTSTNSLVVYHTFIISGITSLCT